MLAPDDRQLLLDALRPPEGTRLDRAIGTTYTLDLQALLVAPLAFALFDWAVEDDGTPNVVAILESLRRFADRTTMFCQAGEIGLPRTYQPALAFLEDRVIQVTPPNPDLIFHPKAWILRFVADDDGPVRYRVLCASRNLTFDRSWDTLLALDGTVGTAPRGDEGITSFVDLLRQLTPVERNDVVADLTLITDELSSVAFEVPEGFDKVRFHTMPVEGWPFPTNPDRTMVVSPFLTAGALGRLRSTSDRAGDVLVSRPETLDRVPVNGWDRRFVLSPLVVQPDALAEADSETPTDGDRDLQGLHAKLFIFEEGDRITLFTGSANATDAAFGGNVELIAELTTTRAQVGIDGLLLSGEGEPAFRDLLDEYASDPGREVDTTSEHLERVLDLARRRLGSLTYTAHYRLDGEDLYDLRLEGTGNLDLPDEIDGIRCWRISAGAGHAVSVHPDNGSLEVRFGHVAGAGVTAFFAFELTAASEGRTDTTTFVVGARVVGGPEDRRRRVLTDLLRSRSDVLRYLLFLLADADGSAFAELAEALAHEVGGAGERRVDMAGSPLLESLLKVLRSDPERLDHVASLIEELRASGRAQDLLPEGLDDIWEPIWQVRQEFAR